MASVVSFINILQALLWSIKR